MLVIIMTVVPNKHFLHKKATFYKTHRQYDPKMGAKSTLFWVPEMCRRPNGPEFYLARIPLNDEFGFPANLLLVHFFPSA